MRPDAPLPRALALFALRVSLGLLMLVWGADKLADPAHGVAVAERFYAGVLGAPALMPVLGVAQLALGACVCAGVGRRWAYPALVAVAAATALGVWRSIVDPWGWWLSGTNALFFPSLIVLAGALVLVAFRDDDRLRPGARPGARPGGVRRVSARG